MNKFNKKFLSTSFVLVFFNNYTTTRILNASSSDQNNNHLNHQVNPSSSDQNNNHLYHQVDPSSSDQNKNHLLKKIDALERNFDKIDGDIEELTEEIRKSEEGLAEDGDDKTELVKYIDRREAKKDDIVGNTTKLRDKAAFDDNNILEDKSLTVAMIRKTSRKDIRTLEKINEEIMDPDYEMATINLLERLQEQKIMSKELQSELTELKSKQEDEDNKKKSFPQDSSDVHQTDFNS